MAEAPVSGDWQNGLLGCFGNCCLCIKAFICPCLVFGSTAGALGKSKCVWTCFALIPIWNLLKAVSLRGQVREQKGIGGGCIGDCVTILFCPICTLVQEAREVSDVEGMDMARQ